MRKIILFLFLVMYIGQCFAQDTLLFNAQPKWIKALDISNKTSFYEDYSLDRLSLKEITKKQFEAFNKKPHHQKFSNHPLIIQWYKFTIYNSSSTDSIDLRLDLGTHYFIKLYASNKLIAMGGAFQTNVVKLTFFNLPFKVPPQTAITFYACTEDRQNQIVKPHIRLKTPLVSANEKVVDQYKTRYLFILLAGLTGCLFFISVYAVCQYYLYRDESFKWYIAYTIVSFFNCLHWMDIRLQISMFSPLIRDIIFSTFIFLTPVLYTFFIGKMLGFSTHFKKMWILVKIFVVIAIFQMVIQFLEVRFNWFIFPINWYSTLISIVPVAILNIVLLILTAKSKDPVKWFLFIGLASMLVFWCLGLTGIFALLPSPSTELLLIFIFQPAFMMFGITIEAICFSFALSYQSKLVFVEKNNMQVVYQKTKATALKAQMNPHFIFNCLNSIKLYTLENDAKSASEYLTMFSQLIRLVLENSDSEKITLKKELETLQLYIALEAMRFKDKINYEIHIAHDVDQQYIKIPPQLLQPYVENAIWHGLMHKKNGGLIKIDVLQPKENLLQIEITDDGIGRELAATYNSKSATRHKSYGLQLTSQRIHIINQLYNMETVIRIIDLKDDNGRAKGTKVEIKIPI